MASQQQNVWQARSKQQSASRTPQNRSNTASPSPAQQSQAQNKPAQQPGNFWAQRATQSRESSNGRGATESAAPSASTSGFNAAEVKAYLARDAQAGYATYKVQETPQGGAKSGASVWGPGKPNNASFFAQLAKQIATLEGGG